MINDPPFATADSLGIFIERGIHNNFLHSATAAYFGESVLNDSATSPLSAYFYKLHGLVNHWWNLWVLKTAPFGYLDDASIVPGGIRVAGWAIDPESVASVDVHVYLNGAFAKTVTANVARPDVEAAHPGHGPLHGFDSIVSAGAGTYEVCVYAINVGAGSDNPQLGCGRVRIKGKEKEKEKDGKEQDKLSKENDKLRKEIDDLAVDRLVANVEFMSTRLDELQAVLGTGQPFISAEQRPDTWPSDPADGWSRARKPLEREE